MKYLDIYIQQRYKWRKDKKKKKKTMKVMAYEECESDWGEEEKFTQNVKEWKEVKKWR